MKDGTDLNDIDVTGTFRVELFPWNELPKPCYERYRASGVACPECGEELLIDTMLVIATYPPKRNYHCPKCEWQGTR